MRDVSRRSALGLAAASKLSADACADKPEQSVHLQLVLAVDTSASVDHDRFELQRDGYAAAFRTPEVQAAIAHGRASGVAVCMTHWMGRHDNFIVHPWTRLSDAQSCTTFADAVAAVRRRFDDGETSIAGAIRFASDLHDTCPFTGEKGLAPRRVIDISGDGEHNQGAFPNAERDAAVARGITINGLPILALDRGLDRHYRHFVIGGTGAFLIAAATYDDFALAIRRKLVREIT
jgi:Protein of unknown function (DUF1194)